MAQADHLIVESTYGNRKHSAEQAADALEAVITRTVRRGGTVVIPAFAVGRAQALYIWQLKQAGRIVRDLPVFLDSPMASGAVDVYLRHAGDQRLSAADARAAFGVATYVTEVEQSKALDSSPMPKIIVSASGMATGGRVIHHLKHYLPDPRSTVLFAGFQAEERAALDGAATVKIHGGYVPVRAEIDSLPMLSAHADADEILRWLRGFERAPGNLHRAWRARAALRLRIRTSWAGAAGRWRRRAGLNGGAALRAAAASRRPRSARARSARVGLGARGVQREGRRTPGLRAATARPARRRGTGIRAPRPVRRRRGPSSAV